MRAVKVLIIEDEKTKSDRVATEIKDFFGKNLSIEFCESFSKATRLILTEKFDLIVADLLLPRRPHDEPSDVSAELLEYIEDSQLNRLTTVVAISRFSDVVKQRHSDFARAGIYLISYADEDQWKACLHVCMQKVEFKSNYDFVIVCALELEREVFEAVNLDGFTYGDLRQVRGLDVRELTIGNYRGACVVQPRMGLVDASITATRALEALNPQLICMSGICGGVAGEVELGTLLVSDICWEHQAGKWSGRDFEISHYQEGLNNEVRVTLSQIISKDAKLSNLASKAGQIPVPDVGAKLAPTATGSAVIASAEYQQEIIKEQHRKIAGIDMEVFGVHRAAALYGQNVRCFAAKTVVDMADEKKDSALQTSGAILAARFTISAVAQLLADA